MNISVYCFSNILYLHLQSRDFRIKQNEQVKLAFKKES